MVIAGSVLLISIVTAQSAWVNIFAAATPSIPDLNHYSSALSSSCIGKEIFPGEVLLNFTATRLCHRQGYLPLIAFRLAALEMRSIAAFKVIQWLHIWLVISE